MKRRAQTASSGTAESSVVAVPGPHAVQIDPKQLTVGDVVCATFAVAGYPRDVTLGWLTPLLEHAARLDIALHVQPLPANVAADRLRRQLARLESARRIDVAKGRLVDPSIEAAADDAADLAGRLARGQQKLFRAGAYLTVHARTGEQLRDECERLRSVASALLLDLVPVTFRQLQGWATTRPAGVDAIGMRRALDTDALAAAFPFTGTDLRPSGVLYGTSVGGAGLVCWDRFACDNHNAVILARSGAGKSYLAKLETLRSLFTGVQCFVIDPEDEYARLAAAVGGTYLHLGAPGVRLNPFDLAPGPDALTRRALFLHTLISVLLGDRLDPGTAAAFDRAVLATYANAGITSEERTHARPAPTLPDLATTLAAEEDPAARTLAARLAPYTTGSHRGPFDGSTSTRPDGHLVVISLRDLPDELKAAGTLLVLDAIWHAVTNPNDRRRRLVVVDEAWLLMREPAGAKFLFRLAKAARKHWCGLTVVTQDAADLLGSDLGQAVVANAATQILLRQAPQAIEAIAEAFALSAGERGFLLAAGRGDALLCTGPAQRVAFHADASPTEHALVTSNPAELAAGEPDP